MQKTVVVDPGHSGAFEPGAQNQASGLTEAEVTLNISQLIRDTLVSTYGHRVVLTRTGSIDNDDLSWRGQMANDEQAALLVSIHCNAAENKSAEGFEAFTTPGDTSSDSAAEYILTAIEEAFPELSARYDLSDGDKDKEARFTVITVPDCAAVLLEVAFISNDDEAALLSDPAWCHKYAQAVAKGINQYLMNA